MKNIFRGKHGPLLIAEIGGNHEGNFEYAKKLTELAISTNVDYVKFQLYTGDTLVSKIESPVRNKHFKKFELKKEEYISLAQLCSELDVTFMASVWDYSAFEFIDQYMPIYKVGSGDLTAYNLIKKIVTTGKPIILSTGLATFDEVKNVVSFIECLDKNYIMQKKLSLLQCASMYPIPNSDANLNVINLYKDHFNLPVGYSDHTVGLDAVKIATAMGVDVLEVHFTDVREGKQFRDHSISATKIEIQALIQHIRKIKVLQGSHNKYVTQSEVESGHVKSFRRGVYFSRNMNKGDVISADDLISLRPMEGVGAERYFELIGKKLKNNKSKYEKMD